MNRMLALVLASSIESVASSPRFENFPAARVILFTTGLGMASS